MKRNWTFFATTALLIAVLNPSAFASTASAATPAVSAGDRTSYVLKADGTVWGFGYNASGQLGIDNTVDQASPVQVPGLTDVVQISAGIDHCLALKSDGTVWAWGDNEQGELGDGTFYMRPAPVQVKNLTNVKAIATGRKFSIVLKQDGTVWTFGQNTDGMLGANVPLAKSNLPVQAVGLTNITAVAAGWSHALAVDASGNAYAWGSGNSGQLGDGTLTRKTVPTRIPTLWSITGIAAGLDSSLALRADGYVFAFGNNSCAQLGIGVAPGGIQKTPYQVNYVYNAVSIYADIYSAAAVTARGEIWKWGYAADSTTFLVNPVKQSDVTWPSSFDIGNSHYLSLKSDGSVLAWGYNNYGQLGTGSAANGSFVTPTAIPNFSALQ